MLTSVVTSDGSSSASTPSSSPSGTERAATADTTVATSERNDTRLLALMSLLLLLSGTSNTVLGKYMNRQFLPPGDGQEARYFEAPWFQSGAVYFGEMAFLVVYFIDNCWKKRRGGSKTRKPSTASRSQLVAAARSPEKQKRCPKWIWVIPATLDLTSGAMINYAVLFLQASTVQMLRNFNVVVAALLTLTFLRTALRLYQWLGVSLLTVGLVIIGLYAVLFPDTDTNYDEQQYLGVIIAICAAFLSAFQFVFEEKLFRSYRCSPVLAVGMMGFFGVVVGAVPLVIGEFVGFERTSETLYMMSLDDTKSTNLLLALVGLTFSVVVSAISGLLVTKLGSGLLRTILIAARYVLVWFVELLLRWNAFTVLNFVGMVVLLAGVSAYSYGAIAKAGCWRYDAVLRKAVNCRGLAEGETDAGRRNSA